MTLKRWPVRLSLYVAWAAIGVGLLLGLAAGLGAWWMYRTGTWVEIEGDDGRPVSDAHVAWGVPRNPTPVIC